MTLFCFYRHFPAKSARTCYNKIRCGEETRRGQNWNETARRGREAACKPAGRFGDTMRGVGCVFVTPFLNRRENAGAFPRQYFLGRKAIFLGGQDVLNGSPSQYLSLVSLLAWRVFSRRGRARFRRKFVSLYVICKKSNRYNMKHSSRQRVSRPAASRTCASPSASPTPRPSRPYKLNK